MFVAMSGENVIAWGHGHHILISNKIFSQRLITYSIDKKYNLQLFANDIEGVEPEPGAPRIID